MTCVIFTDTFRLAEKYGESKGCVTEIIGHNLLHREDCDFQLLDAADYAAELSELPGWKGYKAILLDFFLGMGIEHSPLTSLFIIGGEDVIPMPQIDSPINEGEMLDADFAYCFQEDDPIELDVDAAICNVGRLPMENGQMPSTLKDDLQSYFNLVSMFMESGLPLGNVVMTTTESWLPASKEMMRDLPVAKPKPIYGVTHEDMYVSPSLSCDCNDVRALRQYKRDLERADMLVFNLHGADAPNYSSFYGEGATGHNTPEAFTIESIRNIGARVFNTVACFGARYVGYNRTQSMLLSAMYGGGVLLYTGSCVSALGRSGQIHSLSHDILVPAGMSESLMKLYCHYLVNGMPAGFALLKAKCDYFNTCRSLDGDECALATVLMFNLYGLPVLKSTCEKVKMLSGNLSRPLPCLRSEFGSVTTLFDKSSSSSGLLSHVRSLVDANLQKIKSTVSSHLYQYWGLNPDNMEKVERLTYPSGNIRYRFVYSQRNGKVKAKNWAITDVSGVVKDVIHFKD